MVQWLRAFVALAEDPMQFLVLILSWSLATNTHGIYSLIHKMDK